MWWAGTWSDEPDPAIGREVFGNVPGALLALFYVTVSGFLFLAFYLLGAAGKELAARRCRRSRAPVEAPPPRGPRGSSNEHAAEGSSGAGLMHSAIYYGFIVLFLGTVTLEIDHLLPADLKFLEGRVYQVYSFVLDAFGLIFLVGIAWAAVRRYWQRPQRLVSKSKPEDAWVSGGARPARDHRPRGGSCTHLSDRSARLRNLVLRRLRTQRSRPRVGRRRAPIRCCGLLT